MNGTNYSWVSTWSPVFHDYMCDIKYINTSFVFEYNYKYYLFIYVDTDNTYKIMNEELNGRWSSIPSNKKLLQSYFKEDLIELYDFNEEVLNILCDIILEFLKKRFDL